MNPLIPRPTAISQPFWDGLRDQCIQVPRCQACGHWVFYPRRHCTRCCSLQLSWETVSGRATLASFTLARVPTLEEFAGQQPQNLAIVTLEEGFNMNSFLTGVDEARMRIGMPLRPVFDPLDEAGAVRLLFTSA